MEQPETQVKKKRPGRKPGSKNKAKPRIALDEVTALNAELQQLRAMVKECCTLLQQAASIRIGAMDSESRVTDLSRQQAQLTGVAYERLRSML